MADGYRETEILIDELVRLYVKPFEPSPNHVQLCESGMTQHIYLHAMYFLYIFEHEIESVWVGARGSSILTSSLESTGLFTPGVKISSYSVMLLQR